MSRREDERTEILLVCSSGGHLQQLLALRPAWEAWSHVWVTFDKSDARSLLRDERVVHAYWPTNRSLKNLVRNLFLAWRTVRELRPRVLLTNPARLSAPSTWWRYASGIS